MTVTQLIEALQAISNKQAVVCLCADDFAYAEIDNVTDDTQSDMGDGVIGNVLLTIDSESEVACYLTNDEQDNWPWPRA